MGSLQFPSLSGGKKLMKTIMRAIIATFLGMSLAIVIAGCNYPGTSTDDTPDEVAIEIDDAEIDSSPVEVGTGTTPQETGPVPTNALLPEDFTYQGAIRLPDDFAWGALGMSYYPNGDGGSGSLFVTGF
jgi:hypothetical protein